MAGVRWVLIDQTDGATTSDGSQLSANVLAHIVEAVTAQLNHEYSDEYGGTVQLRVGANKNDIQPGEWAYGFVPELPDAPGASAYHDINGKGVPFALCAVTTCGSLYGPDGVSVDASHEILETAGDQGANQWSDDLKGTLHAYEMCDAVEVQTYGKKCADGTMVQVSNWLMRSWFNPSAPAPFDYMSSVGLSGAVAPSGPMSTAAGQGGNYQIVRVSGKESQIHAKQADMVPHIEGHRRKGKVTWSSRAARRVPC